MKSGYWCHGQTLYMIDLAEELEKCCSCMIPFSSTDEMKSRCTYCTRNFPIADCMDPCVLLVILRLLMGRSGYVRLMSDGRAGLA